MMVHENAAMTRVMVPLDNATLLDQCSVTTFRSSGRGGQHVNKTDSAVRLRHKSTGIVVTCRTERSQYRNKMICLERMRKRLEDLLEMRKPRISTSVPDGAKRKRIEDKMHKSTKKRIRQTPILNDD